MGVRLPLMGTAAGPRPGLGLQLGPGSGRGAGPGSGPGHPGLEPARLREARG